MNASQTLRKPANWEDFETLCKKLWGEIWNCPEIKKNGRSGQAQHGVDIYGIPAGENQYWGIQCKGKEEYTQKQLTEKEIDREIGEATKFQPPLSKFYFATTALKDVRTEEYVRKRNIENKLKGLFEVHLFSWEDIVELIDENKLTHDWYVKRQGFKIQQSIAVTFEDGADEITLSPKFKKKITRYRQKQQKASFPVESPWARMHKTHEWANRITARPHPLMGKETNLSYVPFRLCIHNTGTAPLEEYSLSFQLEGNIQDLAYRNVKDLLFSIHARETNVSLKPDTFSGRINPRRNILVGDDTLVSDNIFVKPMPEPAKLVLKWKLISKNFKDKGELLLHVLPEFDISNETIYLTDASPMETEVKIEDSIVKE